MKLRNIILSSFWFLFIINVFGQADRADSLKRVFIPFLDQSSQSNVNVTTCDLDIGRPCPPDYTNTLSNTNLFTTEEQKLIGEVFVKYKEVTANFGPPGTVFVGLSKTNYFFSHFRRTNEVCLSRFSYTNFEAHEDIIRE